MKKSLIALAVAAGSIAAAQADTTTLYGSVGFSSQFAKTSIDTSGSAWENTADGVKDSLKSVKDNNWNVGFDRARLGVKGNEDLDNGLQAVFKFEVQASGANTGLDGTRDVYIGLKGDFGQVTIGRQGSTWNTDENFFRTSGPAKELNWNPGRASKTIKYETPDFGGFSFAARVEADDQNPASKVADSWDTALAYEANGLIASAAYGKRNNYNYQAGRGNGSSESIGLQLGYVTDQYGIVGNVQSQASYGNVYNVQGKYMLGANELRAGVGFSDLKNGNDQVAYGAGYQYNLSDRTSTWVEGTYNTVENSDNDFTASVGIRHDF